MKKILAFLIVLSIMVHGGSGVRVPVSASSNDYQWAVYIYLCGSDLESYGGCATDDLLEIMDVTLPDDVIVIIETGGAEEWMNNFVDETKLQRYAWTSDGMYLVDEKPRASMGKSKTLSDFISFCTENFPADHEALLFWNHGGGSVQGVEFDEIYNYDSLTMSEISQALEKSLTPSEKNPPLELVGFDCCLMATIDVAVTFSDYAHYMVASQESEPGYGWFYNDWLTELAEKPSMNGAELGRIICDTYYDGNVDYGIAAECTLSVTDLTKAGKLLEAYDAFGFEALASAAEDPAFFAQLGRAANSTENYGGNTDEEGYTNMVDLGHFARQTAWLLPSAQDVLDALDECVIYQVKGNYRSEATGLSCYYCYSTDLYDLEGYMQEGAGEAVKALYNYLLTGELTDEAAAYLASLNIEQLIDQKSLLDVDWADMVPDVDREGSAVLNLGKDAFDIIASIQFALFYMDEEYDLFVCLGFDNDIIADWDNGIFKDNFRGVWGSIGDIPVYMELTFEGEDYNLYSVPIMLNGEEYSMQVVYDFTEEEWEVLGAVKGIDENGMAGKDVRPFAVGDEIGILWNISSYSGDDDFEMCEITTIVVDEDTVFDEAPLWDGEYSMVFWIEDAYGNEIMTDPVFFEIDGDDIYTYT